MKKLTSGLYEVRLQVSPDFIKFAARAAKAPGYFGVEDYLNAVLNMAMLYEMDDEPLSTREIEARRKAAKNSDDGLPF